MATIYAIAKRVQGAFSPVADSYYSVEDQIANCQEDIKSIGEDSNILVVRDCRKEKISENLDVAIKSIESLESELEDAREELEDMKDEYTTEQNA